MRPPASLIAVSVGGSVLGAGLALTGLGARLYPSLTMPFGPWGIWTGTGAALGVDGRALAWPMIALGCAWLAVVVGLWMGLTWTRRVGLALAVLTVPFLGVALVLDTVALAGLLSNSLSRWLAAGSPAVAV